MEVINSDLPQESPICDLARRLPENLDIFYLNVVGITPYPSITIMKKIDLCNYNKNDDDDKFKWEVDYDGDVGTFFDAIAYEKEFDEDRENPVSMGGDGHVGVQDQAGKFIIL